MSTNLSPVLLPDDQLDAGFSGDGLVTVAIGDGDDRARAVVPLADTGYLVAGSTATATGDDFVLLRFATDGMLDAGFADAGKLVMNVAGDDAVVDCLVQPDGRIVVLGTTHVGDTSDVGLLRLMADGTVDGSFGSSGMVGLSLSGGQDEAAAVEILADNKLLVLAAANTQSSTAKLVLIRFDENGDLDTAFGVNSQALVDFDYFETGSALAVAGDGRIVIAGQVWTGSAYDLIVARFNADGTLDGSFDGDGRLQVDIGGSPWEEISDIALQADGRIVLVGERGDAVGSDAFVMRLNADGGADSSFGDGDGMVVLDAGGYDGFSSVAIQADGKIVAGGQLGSGLGEAWLVRFNSDGSLDAGFDGDGSFSTLYGNGTASIHDLAIDAAGHLVAVGDSYGGTQDIGVLRLAAGFGEQFATAGSAFSWAIPAGVFFDGDGDALAYSVSLADGSPLPAWLAFDDATLTLHGTPGDGDFGVHALSVVASDGAATATGTFRLEVTTPFIEALRYTTHFDWNESANGVAGTSLRFSFLEAAPVGADATEQATFVAMASAQRDAVRDVLEIYGAMVGISFQEVANGGDLEFATYLQEGTLTAGYASNQTDEAGQHSTVWINRAFEGFDTPVPGEHHFETLIHEIGHALGLKHPGDYGGGMPPFLPLEEDTTQYTTMSYVERDNTLFLAVQPLQTGYDFDYGYISAATPMLYDVAALQFIYGANLATAAGDDVYAFDPDVPFFRTLWDGGGQDTLDIANFATDCTIDLTPGGFSSIRVLPDPLPDGYTGTTASYDGQENLAIAFGAVIENAIGGSGNDHLVGNAVANTLRGGTGRDTLGGGAGNDILDGGLDADTLTGGTGNDFYRVDHGGDSVVEYLGEGIDFVSARIDYALPDHVENLLLNASVTFRGPRSGFFGGPRKVRIDLGIDGTGNDGDNLIVGNRAANELSGGGASDVLIGGAGADVFVFDVFDGSIDRIADFGAGDVIRVVGSGEVNYDTATGSLSLDGAQFVVLNGWSGLAAPTWQQIA